MNKHFFSGVFMLAVGLLLLLFLIPFGIDSPKKIRFAALSPTYYPQIVALILSVIGVAIIFKNRRPHIIKETDEFLEDPLTKSISKQLNKCENEKRYPKFVSAAKAFFVYQVKKI